MSTIMTLNGVSLGTSFPVYGSSFEWIRDSDQGSSFRRVRITLGGFVEGMNTEEVMAIYAIIRDMSKRNETYFTYIQDGVTVHENRQVFLGAYQEPEDREFAKWVSGDYGFEMYFFEDNSDASGLVCSFGSYTFDKIPKWGRTFSQNKADVQTAYTDLATIGHITLSGHLFAENHSDLMQKVELLQNAFRGNQQQLLVYGDFAATCYVDAGSEITPDVMRNYCYYNINLTYFDGDKISFSYKTKLTRIHNNPVIKDQPHCDSRTIQYMGVSGQTITYTMSAKAISLQKARDILNEELYFSVEPGGIEMPGGDEDWDHDTNMISVSVVKFYNRIVVPNIGP